MVGYGQLFADPLGQEIGHLVVTGGHVLPNWLLEVAAILLEPQVDGYGAGIDEAVEIGTEGAYALQQVERAHGIDVQILAVV